MKLTSPFNKGTKLVVAPLLMVMSSLSGLTLQIAHAQDIDGAASCMSDPEFSVTAAGPFNSFDFSCDSFSATFCSFAGNWIDDVTGKTASEACCECGGGIYPSPSPSSSPSSYPSSSPPSSDTPSSSPPSPASCVDFDGFSLFGLGTSCNLFTESPFFCSTLGGFPDSDFSGMTANQACCACGGGSTETLSPTSIPTLAPTTPASTTCTDNPVGWYDSWGPDYNCAWYSENLAIYYGNTCGYHGDTFENFNMTANQACCACGGGTTDGTVTTLSPTPATTLVPTTCTDNPVGWYDRDGPHYHCAWYSENLAINGTTCGDTGDIFENFNTTANQACCACGGGTTDGAVTPSPTPAPTPVPTTCTDNPVGWYDSDGPEFSCKWYGSEVSNCVDFGDGFENFNTTANQACCACGGGTSTSNFTTSNIITVQHTDDNMHSYVRRMVTKGLDYFFPENEDVLEWQASGKRRHLKK